jgi:crotonobetainyl-CoA:carnitine CoA-transferase CaiB-like acyl-CoA transferase
VFDLPAPGHVAHLSGYRLSGPFALEGLRVLDLANERGVYCGKLFADLGADVVKVEPPGGDPSRWIPPFWGDKPGPDSSLFFLYTNANKRSVTLDLETVGGRSVYLRLAADADLVIETFPPGHLDALGLGYGALSAANPRLVLTSITGFGQTGPFRDYASSDLIASALGGCMYVIGHPEDPPVRLAGGQADIGAGLYAAVGSIIALRVSAATGRGQHVDISALETTVSTTHVAGVSKWLDDRLVSKRMGSGLPASIPSGAYRCQDGLVYLMVNRPAHWKALAEWIHAVTGNEEVLLPMFDGPSSARYEYRELLDVYIEELTSQLTVEAAYREGQRRHIAFTPVNTAEAVANDPHLAARDYFQELEHPGRGTLRYAGAPYRLSETPWSLRTPAPGVGEHNDSEFLKASSTSGKDPELAPVGYRRTPSAGSGQALRKLRDSEPLAGLRVLELSLAMAGPWVGRFMAYCGAETIRVESRKHPEVTRLYVPPWAPEMGIQSQLSPWFPEWNAGKRFISLDLKKPGAIDLVMRLAVKSDVVVENYAAGVMDRLGLAYAAFKQIKPDIIMLSSSGFGDSGPSREYVTWGSNIEAVAGMANLSGFPERECSVTQYVYSDVLGSLHGLFAVMAALRHRDRTGEGQYINISQSEVTTGVIGHVLMEYFANGRAPERQGNRSATAAPHGCYRCAGDDRWCAVAVRSDREWLRLCAVVERLDLAEDPRFATLEGRLAHADELDQALEQWTCARDAYEVMHAMQAEGIAAGVAQTAEDLWQNDQQLAARGFYETIPHLKRGTTVVAGVPLGLTGTPGRSGPSGQAVGEDNDYVFRDVLGLTEAEIEAYTETGAIEIG